MFLAPGRQWKKQLLSVSDVVRVAPPIKPSVIPIRVYKQPRTKESERRSSASARGKRFQNLVILSSWSIRRSFFLSASKFRKIQARSLRSCVKIFSIETGLLRGARLREGFGDALLLGLGGGFARCARISVPSASAMRAGILTEASPRKSSQEMAFTFMVLFTRTSVGCQCPFFESNFHRNGHKSANRSPQPGNFTHKA